MQLKWYEVRFYVHRLPVSPKLDWEHYMPRVKRRTLMCPSHCAIYYIKKAIVKLFIFTPWTRIGEVEVELQLFLASTPFVAEWSTSCFGQFIPAFNWTLGGLQSQYWLLEIFVSIGNRIPDGWAHSLVILPTSQFSDSFTWSNWSCKISVKAKRLDIFVKLFKTTFRENASEVLQLLHAYRQYGRTEWLSRYSVGMRTSLTILSTHCIC
jgi:hypothetical protein